MANDNIHGCASSSLGAPSSGPSAFAAAEAIESAIAYLL
jgi:hypothetical protein